MTNYKQIADIMQAQPADTKWLNKEEFKNLMEKRKLKFVLKIDEQPNVIREVWGNNNFQIIVLRSKRSEEFQVL